MPHSSVYWTSQTQEIVDFLDDLLKPEDVPDLIRAERELVPDSTGRECWRLTLWLTRPTKP